MVDYSRFDKIDVSDDEEGPSIKKTAEKVRAQAPEVQCANCGAAGARLRCSVCKKEAYCNRTCQRGDWRFHKRKCEKPKPKEESKEKDKKKEMEKKKEKSSSSASAPAPAPAPAKKPAKKPVKESSGDAADLDEEDEKALAEVSKGYRYFSRKLAAEEEALIGDITPKQITPAAEAAAAAPAPMKRAVSESSVWNSAGTWEERSMTGWTKERLNELIVGQVLPAGDAKIKVEELADFSGDSDIVLVRGTQRYVYDFKFNLKIDIEDGDKTSKAELLFPDVSNDSWEDGYYTEFKWGKPKTSSKHRDAVEAAVKGPLKALVSEKLQVWVKEFNAK